MPRNEEGSCQFCVCMFDFPKVKGEASEIVGFDAVVVYSMKEMGQHFDGFCVWFFEDSKRL